MPQFEESHVIELALGTGAMFAGGIANFDLL
jgi:hypothetical protein